MYFRQDLIFHILEHAQSLDKQKENKHILIALLTRRKKVIKLTVPDEKQLKINCHYQVIGKDYEDKSLWPCHMLENQVNNNNKINELPLAFNKVLFVIWQDNEETKFPNLQFPYHPILLKGVTNH